MIVRSYSVNSKVWAGTFRSFGAAGVAASESLYHWDQTTRLPDNWSPVNDGPPGVGAKQNPRPWSGRGPDWACHPIRLLSHRHCTLSFRAWSTIDWNVGSSRIGSRSVSFSTFSNWLNPDRNAWANSRKASCLLAAVSSVFESWA